MSRQTRNRLNFIRRLYFFIIVYVSIQLYHQRIGILPIIINFVLSLTILRITKKMELNFLKEIKKNSLQND